MSKYLLISLFACIAMRSSSTDVVRDASEAQAPGPREVRWTALCASGREVAGISKNLREIRESIARELGNTSQAVRLIWDIRTLDGYDLPESLPDGVNLAAVIQNSEELDTLWDIAIRKCIRDGDLYTDLDKLTAIVEDLNRNPSKDQQHCYNAERKDYEFVSKFRIAKIETKERIEGLDPGTYFVALTINVRSGEDYNWPTIHSISQKKELVPDWANPKDYRVELCAHEVITDTPILGLQEILRRLPKADYELRWLD